MARYPNAFFVQFAGHQVLKAISLLSHHFHAHHLARGCSFCCLRTFSNRAAIINRELQGLLNARIAEKASASQEDSNRSAYKRQFCESLLLVIKRHFRVLNNISHHSIITLHDNNTPDKIAFRATFYNVFHSTEHKNSNSTFNNGKLIASVDARVGSESIAIRIDCNLQSKSLIAQGYQDCNHDCKNDSCQS